MDSPRPTVKASLKQRTTSVTNEWKSPVQPAEQGWWKRKSKGRKAAWIGGGVVAAIVATSAAGAGSDSEAKAIDVQTTTIETQEATDAPETTEATAALECGDLGDTRELSNGSVETCMTDGEWIVTFVPVPADVAVTTVPPTASPNTATPTTAAPKTTAPTTNLAAFTITGIVDGDTVELNTGQSIRLLGYDTPDQGECGYQEAADALQLLLNSGTVTITPDNGDDTDHYGRLLRHVLVDDVPVGLTMIEQGKANARYDSLDGYPRHRYQDDYRSADGANTFTCAVPVAPAPVPAPAPAAAAPAVPSNNGPFKNCDAVRAAGRAPILAGEPGFESKFDRDGDGVGCE